jgi:hypothetical protein
MIQIVELSFQNFVDFHLLLLQRGEAPFEYYKWKYLEQPNAKFPTGFIAYLDNMPVGCIGLINRVYVGENGQSHNSTWFADWFVSSKSRGMGIGLSLMRKIVELTPFSFGVPGPKSAQIIAEKAGYSFNYGFYEIRVVARPWNYGIYLRNDSFYKRFLRAVKYSILQPRVIGTRLFQVSKFSIDSVRKSKVTTNRLLKDTDYLKWLISMPTDLNANREYWILDIRDTQIIFFTENDLSQLRRARILDIISDKNNYCNLEFIFNLIPIFKKLGLDYYQVYMYLEEIPTSKSSFVKIETQYSTIKLSNFFQIGIADKESRWRDLQL